MVTKRGGVEQAPYSQPILADQRVSAEVRALLTWTWRRLPGSVLQALVDPEAACWVFSCVGGVGPRCRVAPGSPK